VTSKCYRDKFRECSSRKINCFINKFSQVISCLWVVTPSNRQDTI